MELFEVGEALGWSLEAGFLSLEGFTEDLFCGDLEGTIEWGLMC